VQKVLRLGVGQMDPKIGDPKGNMTKLSTILKSATAEEIDVLVLPELMNSGYAFESKEQAKALAEVIPKGPFSKALKTWSKPGRFIVAGLCEDAPEGLHNSAAIFGGGEYLGTYRKIHLFDEEKLWFLPGKEEPPVVEFNGFRFGVMVCFDWAFPELARVLALKGVQVILHPANLILRSLYCIKAMITRSIENRVFTATASRVGTEGKFKFMGASQVTDPRGLILTSMNDTETGVSWVEIDPTVADDKTLTPRNDVFEDRVPDLYRRIIDGEGKK
jgi:predicted amidohydrolase